MANISGGIVNTAVYKARRAAHYTSQYAYSQISNGLNFVYGLPNPRLRDRAIWPVYFLARMQALLAEGGQQGHVLVAQGRSAVGGQPLRVGFVGSWEDGQRKQMAFFQHLLFEEGTMTLEVQADFPLWQVRRQAEALAGQVDLVAVSCSDLLTWQPARGDWVSGPGGIRMVFDFCPGEAWEAAEHRMAGQADNRRKVRKAGLSYRLSQVEDDFRAFYHEMHLPMVKARYRDYGDVIHEDGLREVFKRKGSLLQILDADGSVVGGGLQYVKNNVVYGLINGVRGGDPSLVRKGVLMAVYYFGLKWAWESGLRRFDAGVCLPFTNNGLFKHKRDWGFQPVLNWWKPYSHLFWSADCTPAALAWLKAHPYVPHLARWGGPNIQQVYA